MSTPEEKLLSSLVANSVRDLTKKPIDKLELDPDTRSALWFLFTPASTVYLEYLDIDPSQYRKRLTNIINDKSKFVVGGISEYDRRTMRINWEIWSKNPVHVHEEILRAEEL